MTYHRSTAIKWMGYVILAAIAMVIFFAVVSGAGWVARGILGVGL